MQKIIIMDKSASRTRIEPMSSVGTFFHIIISLAFCIFVIKVTEGDFFLGKIFRLFGICVGGYIIAKAIQSRLAMRKFEKRNTRTTAWVIERYVKTGYTQYGHAIRTYYVVINFNAVGKKWTLRAMVDKELYDKKDINPISVIYADYNPRCVLLEGESEFERFV
jgi:hypothetical protein